LIKSKPLLPLGFRRENRREKRNLVIITSSGSIKSIQSGQTPKTTTAIVLNETHISYTADKFLRHSFGKLNFKKELMANKLPEKTHDNLNYWKEFYSHGEPPTRPSSFAQFVNSKIENKDATIIDVGCGNGRDTQFFEENGLKAIGIDLVQSENFLGTSFQAANATEQIPNGDIIYCRFFIHALTEAEFDSFLQCIKSQRRPMVLFIETRSTNGISSKEKCETYFKSGIGTEHFRMLYSLPYLFKKLSQYFEITFMEESNNFSPFRGENPYLIRMICHG